MTLSFEDFEQVGPAQGSNEGGRYVHDDGSEWYLKYPTSERQGHNEIMASQFYNAMGFDALHYERVDNGMVASRWRHRLPSRSDPSDLRESDVVQEAFLPSALIANWDVIGLVYDNCLYDPASMDEPVFLDFGGSFDTRAMGGPKPFGPDTVMALEGFTDPSINQSAATVFDGMTHSLYVRSKERIRSLTDSSIERMIGSSKINGAGERLDAVRSRRALLLDTDYEEVFQ